MSLNIILKMPKYKTLNNYVSKDIIRYACCPGNFRAAYMKLYNHRDEYEYDAFQRILSILFELAPLTLQLYKTLPYVVQSFYNQLWLNYE